MALQGFYQERTALFQQHADKLLRRENTLSWTRLVTFLLIFVLFFLLRSFSLTLALVVGAGCLVAFGLLIKQHVITEQKKDNFRHLAEINNLELKSIQGDSSGFASGQEFSDREHPNSLDLDLYGHASVFQFINRTVSKPGAEMLARWLAGPAGMEEIKQRQQAIEELKPEIDWRQEWMTIGYFTRKSLNNPDELLQWMKGKKIFRKAVRLRMVTIALSLLGIFFTAWVIAGSPAAILLPILAVNFLFYFTQGNRINRLHQQVSKSAGLLMTYANLIRLIEGRKFRTEKLHTLQKQFGIIPPASETIKSLSKLVNRLDTRLNVMVSVPLNLFFFWDIHVCLALEKWKKQHAPEIDKWLGAMAEFEVLNSLANMAFNNPGWAFPTIVDTYFTLQARNMGHPLIPEQRRVLNDLMIKDSGRILIITGSNMSGKSTFLRTCGVNTLLALAGAPVCAGSFTISHTAVYSCMRISDSLEDNTSSFYAELKRLAAIIRKAEQDPRVMLLLDEILRGTNSSDRHTGSVALIRQLAGYGTVALIATHDLTLAGLQLELPESIDNFHFDVKVEGEELYFDYKLNPGICTSMNASLLMKKMGIRI